ncbi:hypothetical protein KSP39_PZI017966 [Platanthera zijinensis]|uniref:Uncharacterized protein n=1 Tax=Platanthera zijinensis TaxID=2320716 RepID=A0AAP0B5H7_9ASPA
MQGILEVEMEIPAVMDPIPDLVPVAEEIVSEYSRRSSRDDTARDTGVCEAVSCSGGEERRERSKEEEEEKIRPLLEL